MRYMCKLNDQACYNSTIQGILDGWNLETSFFIPIVKDSFKNNPNIIRKLFSSIHY